jgi:Rrf2 family protein
MVSQTTRYALQILGYLADHGGGLVSGDEIARQTNIPANYLSKILNQLRKAGFVESQKGWGGGFALKPDASLRPIGDVLETFEGSGPNGIDECVFGLPRCDEQNPCPLHSHWAKIRDSYAKMLQGTTIAKLKRQGSKMGRNSAR